MPPFTGADEEAHFIRAYGISNGELVIRHDQALETPTAYKKTLGCMQSKAPNSGQTYTYAYAAYAEDKGAALNCAFDLPLNESSTEGLISSAPGYSPTTYIPQVIAVFIGRVLDMPVIAIGYLMRVFVLVAYMAMIALAIRLLPIRKWALVGMALLPHSIMQITNPGADYMLLGAVAIFVAIIVRSNYVPKTSVVKWDMIFIPALLLFAILMVLPKGLFPGVLFLPLLFFYGGLKYRLITKVVVTVLTLLTAFAWQRFGGPGAVDAIGSSLTTSLLDFPFVFIKTMFEGWINQDFIYVKTGFGIDERIGMPSVAITVINILFAIYLFVNYSGSKIKSSLSAIQSKLFTFTGWSIAVAVAVGTFAALYIGAAYLQNDSGVIRGVQARYFYPAYFMLAMLPFTRIFNTTEKRYRLIVLLGSIVILSLHVLVIAMEYRWGPF